MSLAPLLASALLSFWLWQLPPPPYGLPRGATPGTDTTAPDGTRTITYTSQGNKVEVKIGPNGATTETTTTANGKVTINYDTVFNAGGSRTETRDGGAEVRTVGANGRTQSREVTTEVPVEGDSTTTRRTIRTTEYDARGRPTRVTEATELHGLVEGWTKTQS